MTATKRSDEYPPAPPRVEYPRTTIVEGDNLIVAKWFPTDGGRRTAEFDVATGDGVITLRKLHVSHDRTRGAYHLRNATLENIHDRVLELLRWRGYTPAMEAGR